MRADTILHEPLAAQGIGSRRDQRARVDELLDQVGLPRSAADRYPHEFSGGQRQRVGLARALTLSPKLIVPTSWCPRWTSRSRPRCST